MKNDDFLIENFYVVETSSNLNENPKIEQYSFENDEELFLFYENFFKEAIKNARRETAD